jgi:hypothetical protein
VSTLSESPPTINDHEKRDSDHPDAAKSGEGEIRLLVSFIPVESNTDAIEVAGTPVMVKEGSGGHEDVRNLDAHGFDAHPLADLQMRALAVRDTGVGEMYLQAVEYRQCFAIDLRRVEAMHKTLRRVDRALHRVQTELGPPETCAAYLARCAASLRISSFGFRAGTSTGWHDTNKYQWTDAAGMVWRVAEHLTRWRSKEEGQ